MKKTKKIIISMSLVVICLLLILATYFCIKVIASNKMLGFLSEKYSVSTSEFEIVDYSQGHYYFTIEDTGLPDPKFKWTNYKWQVKRNGRTFFVNYESKKFYDDYKLEDIEVWATKWLKDNIDEKIIGVGYSTRNIINHQKSLGTDGNMHLYTENNIYDFMENKETFVYYEDDYLKMDYSEIYYIADGMSDDERKEYYEEINDIIDKKFLNNQYFASVSRLNHLETYSEKSYVWYNKYYVSYKSRFD